jgi:hypothetical protein
MQYSGAHNYHERQGQQYLNDFNVRTMDYKRNARLTENGLQRRTGRFNGASLAVPGRG